MTIVKAEPRIDSRLLAKSLRNGPDRALRRQVQGLWPTAISKGSWRPSAAGGFAGAVVNVLEVGIANLPKFEREAR